MKTVCILHDSYSSNSEPWIVAVSDQLRVRGNTVFVPRFPTPIGQDYIAWKLLFHSTAELLNEKSVVVCVGISCAFLLTYMSENKELSFGRVIFLAPFVQGIQNQSENMVAKSFISPTYDWADIRMRIQDTGVFISSNDSVVPASHSVYVADQLNTSIVTLQDRGHFRAIDSVRDIVEITEAITKETSIQIIKDSSSDKTHHPTVSIETTQPEPSPKSEPQMVVDQKLEQQVSVPSPKVNAILTVQPTEVVQSPALGTAVSPEVYQSVPVSPVQHSLVKDFSTALINASPKEVSTTLKDYREGKQIEKESKTIAPKRLAIIVASVVFCCFAGYIVVKGYTQSRPVEVPQAIEIGFPAKSVLELYVDPALIDADVQKIAHQKLKELELSSGDIGILRLVNDKGDTLSIERSLELIDPGNKGVQQKSVTDDLTIGAIKERLGFSPFIVVPVSGRDSVLYAKLAAWKTSLPQGVLAIVSPEFVGSAAEIESYEKLIGNISVTLVAEKKADTQTQVDIEQTQTSEEITVVEEPKAIRPQGVIALSPETMSYVKIADSSIFIDKSAPLFLERVLQAGDSLVIDPQLIPGAVQLNDTSAGGLFARTIEESVDLGSVMEYTTRSIAPHMLNQFVKGVGLKPEGVVGGQEGSAVGKQQNANVLFVYSIVTIGQDKLLIIAKTPEILPILVEQYRKEVSAR
jgi:predicted alpha/beta hydrolase family esterase